MGAALTLALVAVAPAVAQTPSIRETVTITLKASPAVQDADFDKSITISGKVTGSEALTSALAEGSLRLNVSAVALGYNRAFDVAPIKPAADGTFHRKIDAAINAHISVSPAGSDFSGTSPTVTTHWKPVPEIFNYSEDNNKTLVIEYRASIPGGIPFLTGSFKMRRGNAKQAFFYAGPTDKPTTRLGHTKLKSSYDGEVHAKFSIPFKQLPKLPPGAQGRVYACFKGVAFLGTDPLDGTCGKKKSTGRIIPRDPAG
jgi:hypothetical protein